MDSMMADNFMREASSEIGIVHRVGKGNANTSSFVRMRPWEIGCSGAVGGVLRVLDSIGMVSKKRERMNGWRRDGV